MGWGRFYALRGGVGILKTNFLQTARAGAHNPVHSAELLHHFHRRARSLHLGIIFSYFYVLSEDRLD